MTSTTSSTTSAAEPTPIRSLTPTEAQAVSGGPGGYPVLGSPIDGPRELTPAEAGLVAGAPGGFPVLSIPPAPQTQGAPR